MLYPVKYPRVAVIGGSGFIGRYLVRQLLAAGHQVRIAVRRRSHAAAIQMLPLTITECNVHEPAQLAAFLDGADAVINLVGVLQDKRAQPYGPGFKKAHVVLPEKIVAACAQLRIRRLIHVSALNADSHAPSMYLRSKGDGEKVILAAAQGPDGSKTTIFRPSVIFGPEDKFLNTFAQLQKVFPAVPLACADAKFQPVYVGDVAKAIVNALEKEACFGQVYELGGPRVYTLAELVRFAGSASGHRRPVIGLPMWAARLQGAVFEHVPNGPISRDNIDSMQVDSVLHAPIDPVLALTPATVEAVASAYLAGKPVGQRYAAPSIDSTDSAGGTYGLGGRSDGEGHDGRGAV